MAHEAIAECVTDVLTTFWRPLWSITEHATWNLFFYTIKKHTTSASYFKIFLNYSKAGLCPLWQTRKKTVWRNLLSIQNEAFSLVAMHNKELWLVKENHATVKLDSIGFSWNEDLQRKQNWTSKSTNVKESAGKINSVFVIRAALWAKSLNVSLNIAGVKRIHSENTRLRSTLDAIWFEFWMKGGFHFPDINLCQQLF